MNDLRIALRQLTKTPGFTTLALLTLALGIGINTCVFSVLNVLMFRPLPYENPGKIVQVVVANPQNQSNAFSPANFLDVKAQQTALLHFGVLTGNQNNLSEPGQPPEQLSVRYVSPSFFDLLGVAPTLGRTFTTEEEVPGKDLVAVLGYGTWMRRYGGDPNILGRQLRLDGQGVTIVGVMPASFDTPLLFGNVDLWRPEGFSAESAQTRETAWLYAYGRLKPGMTLAQAQTEYNAIATKLGKDYPKYNKDIRLNLGFLEDQRRRGQNFNWMLMSLAVAVLLVACANLANLQLVRAIDRSREHAIRLALGASRLRLVRYILTESLILSIVGGVFGMLVAVWGNDLTGSHIPLGPDATLTVSTDWRVLVFACVVSTLVGITFGVLPALTSARTDINSALKQSTGNASSDRSRHLVRDGLVVSEIAIALTLVVAAAFLVSGLRQIANRDLGWKPDHLITGYVPLPYSRFPKFDQCIDITKRIESELASMPGVTHAAIAGGLPIFGSAPRYFDLVGQSGKEGVKLSAAVMDVTSDYIATAGMRLLRGRTFAANDREDAPHVALINQSMAKALWPTDGPLGQQILISDPEHGGAWEIVGVVNDSQPAITPGGAPPIYQIYRPIAQAPTHWLSLLVRTSTNPTELARPMRLAVQRVDPDSAIGTLLTAERWISVLQASSVTIEVVVSTFGLFALLISAVGLYGVISYLVQQRTREIGIRLALGADPSATMRMVLLRGVRLSLVGVVIGMAGGWGVVRLCTSIVPGLPPADWSLFAEMAVVVFGVAVAAAWIPARRASRVDPMVALRNE